MSAKKSTRPGDKRDTRDNRPGFEIPPFTLAGWEAPALGASNSFITGYIITSDCFCAALAPLPDLAEERAQLRLREAHQLREKTGRPTAQTKALEAAAERWRDLAGISEADAGPLAAMWQQVAHEAIAGLLIRASGKSEDAIAYLVTLAAQVLDGLRGLAAGGNVKAGAALMTALETAATDFETLAWHKPEVFRARARNSFQIPGTIGRHPDKARGNAAFADRLEVGADYDVAHVPKKGRKIWGHDTPATVFALKLKAYLEHVRQMVERMIANDPEALADFREAVTGEPHRPKKESGYNVTSDERVTGTGKAYTLSRLKRETPELFASVPEWLADALALEAFGPRTYPAWAAIGWRILDRGKHPALSNYGTRIVNRNRGAEAGVNLVNSDTAKALLAAFRTLATGKARKK